MAAGGRVAARGDGYAPDAEEGRRKELPVPAVTVKTLGQGIADALRRLQSAMGGKNLAEFFDGRDGEEVAQSTISRWISEPRRFPAVFLPALVELDPEFRGEVLRHLTASLATDAAVVARLSTKAADEYRRAVEGVIVEQVKPGLWVRR